ncbi:hypothetical protein BU16DRAFT_539178 [Lophium mytilinum]|uniref:F-box domain-containing protein n=1 Tax=Lophium mytilinum TaxID=390894 RepID=A0A6A6QW57_9PEZI|nr:hypothetical protein BU16DRAFT_539178 [Lophium mytilinum]
MPSTSNLAHDPSIPQVGVCHFLRLPQELRDIIYEYAITEPNNRVICCQQGNRQVLAISSPSPIAANPSLSEANQLQFVSKQLRAETLDLTLKFNPTVAFLGIVEERGDSSAYGQCNHFLMNCNNFLMNCARAILAKLSCIELELSGNISYLPIGSIQSLASKLYHMNPQASMVVRLVHWNIMSDEFIWYFSEYGEYLIYACQFVRFENVPNLRFRPAGDLDRKRLRRKLLREMRDYFPSGEREKMLEEAKRWYKDGLPRTSKAGEGVGGQDDVEDDEDEHPEDDEDEFVFDEGDLQCLFDYEEESEYPSDTEVLEDGEGGEDEEELDGETDD